MGGWVGGWVGEWVDWGRTVRSCPKVDGPAFYEEEVDVSITVEILL